MVFFKIEKTVLILLIYYKQQLTQYYESDSVCFKECSFASNTMKIKIHCKCLLFSEYNHLQNVDISMTLLHTRKRFFFLFLK